MIIATNMKILIINGPNLNLTGKREPLLYGNIEIDSYLVFLRQKYQNVDMSYCQSNIEGEIINCIQNADGQCDGIILNAGGYSHTSVAIADAIAAISIPVVEVHITNVFAREDYRQNMLTASKCKGVISGFGLKSYELALQSFLLD